MVKSIKVKDNSNIFIMIYIFCLFPLFFVAPIFAFDLSYTQSALISMSILTVFFIFYFKNLIAKQDEYAIIADENEVTFLKSGTFRWEEINTIKAIDDNGFFTKRPQYYIDVALKNGKKLSINVTNFDYQFEELVTILKSLGKLDSRSEHPIL